jgi:hypothetical protein
MTMIKLGRMRWVENVARMGNGNAYRISIEKLDGKRPLGKTRRRWVDNIKIYLGERLWGGVDWTGSG